MNQLKSLLLFSISFLLFAYGSSNEAKKRQRMKRTWTALLLITFACVTLQAQRSEYLLEKNWKFRKGR